MQVQISGARITRTVLLHGRILSPGVYEENEGRLSKSDFQHMLDYASRQRSLPVEQRDNPPIYVVKTIPLETVSDTDGKYERIDYYAKDISELRAICKERGIRYGKKESAESLAKKLTDYDDEELAWTEQFKDLNEFMALSESEKLEYIDQISTGFGDIEPDSDEAVTYSENLIRAVELYSAQSQSEEVNIRLREVLEQYNA